MTRATELRTAFDRSFADAPRTADAAGLELLSIRLGGEPYALALADVASIHVDLAIAPVPSADATLVGIAAIRAALVPVHDLRLLVGAPPVGVPRWLVVAADSAAAYAFDGFDRQVRVAVPAIPDAARLVRAIATIDGRATPIIDLHAVGALLPRTKEP